MQPPSVYPDVRPIESATFVGSNNQTYQPPTAVHPPVLQIAYPSEAYTEITYRSGFEPALGRLDDGAHTTGRISTPPADLSTSVYQGPKVKGKKKGNKRRFIVCRHGERVDFTFGRDWIKENFDSAGRYTRIDLNMPKSLPIRPGGPAGFVMDSPLTNIGHYQAHLTGEALKEAGVNITCIYASPALRCVQTAAAIIEGMQLNVPIRLEPGLFEWLGYYPSGLPRFLIPSEFESAGFNVDLDSPPCYTLARLQESLKENVEQYFNRCLEVSRFILQKEPRDTIVVGHASSLDTNVRGLLGKRPRPTASFMDMVRQTSYAATVSIEEVASDKWTISPILVSSSVLHQGNPPFNSKQFLLR